ncbi:hypothetical protein BY458DRAFT_550699 [Sporodiniella umbellata]|nr:hypothetical protein BY458DRAFT_550699 [Sporodiniella umbellata]
MADTQSNNILPHALTNISKNTLTGTQTNTQISTLSDTRFDALTDTRRPRKPGEQLSLETRRSIILLRKASFSYGKIMKILNLKKSTVVNVCQKAAMGITDVRPRSGRPKKHSTVRMVNFVTLRKKISRIFRPAFGQVIGLLYSGYALESCQTEWGIDNQSGYFFRLINNAFSAVLLERLDFKMMSKQYKNIFPLNFDGSCLEIFLKDNFPK